MTKYVTFLIAILGALLAVYTAATARTDPPKAELAATPSINPFPAGIAATGAVEASSRNIALAAPEGGLAIRVLAQVGDVVKAGDPLVELDARPLQAELLRARAARDTAAARVARLKAQPRSEEVPVAEAATQAARSELADWQDQEKRLREAGPAAASERDLMRVMNSMATARARIAEAEASLALVRAGAWRPDIDVAESEVKAADAQVASLEALIERRIIRAPINGTILKRNIEPGQYATSDSRAPAMIMGDLTTLHVRARVDEEDLPMLRQGAKAIARIRGRAEIKVPLTMIRIEPLAEPKTQLAGSTTERVDTRVLEVLFRVEPTQPAPPLYPGQNVDVFIEAAGNS